MTATAVKWNRTIRKVREHNDFILLTDWLTDLFTLCPSAAQCQIKYKHRSVFCGGLQFSWQYWGGLQWSVVFCGGLGFSGIPSWDYISGGGYLKFFAQPRDWPRLTSAHPKLGWGPTKKFKGEHFKFGLTFSVWVPVTLGKSYRHSCWPTQVDFFRETIFWPVVGNGSSNFLHAL